MDKSMDTTCDSGSLVNMQYCQKIRQKKSMTKHGFTYSAGRTDEERHDISKSQSCDGVLFSTPQGTKTTVRQTIYFLSEKLKVLVQIKKNCK